jgi:hypothetical protein
MSYFRQSVSLLVSAMVIALSAPANALMAGVAPDSPAARVDPNTASSPFAGVGSVVVNGDAVSGVVIASQYVLTAAHVASGQSPSSITFMLNLGGTTPWTSSVEAITVYPTFSFPYDDLAVLKLANPVPDGVPIYQMYSGTIATGLIIKLVGYGASGNGNAGVTVAGSSSVKRTGENVVDLLTSTLDSSGLTSKFFLYDFDGPTGDGPLGGPTLGNSLETLVAVGDSGSPSFVINNGGLQLFGINTFVSDSPSTAPITYEFGTVGGGIVASDPRFASWLQTSTAGTLGQTPSNDVPVPMWANELLALSLAIAILVWSQRRNAPIEGNHQNT